MAMVGQDNFNQIGTTQTMSGERKKILKQLPDNSRKQTIMLALASILVVIAGIATGWKLSGGLVMGDEAPQVTNVTPGEGGNVKEAGVQDVSQFETVEDGILRAGGFEGEGTHHLEKEGATADKYPYLTSAVIDLESFVGKEVTIWGHTIAGQKAGWLIDVAKIKVKD